LQNTQMLTGEFKHIPTMRLQPLMNSWQAAAGKMREQMMFLVQIEIQKQT